MSAAYEHARLNEKKWDSRAETFDRKRYDFFRVFQHRVVSIAGLEKGQTLLDLGCGTGWAVRYAAGIVGAEGRACGIDLSPRMIEKAKESSREIGNVSFHVGNAEEPPFPDESFDVVMCTNSFHHYLNPSRALREARRVLKPGGKIYILDIASDDPFMKWVDARSRLKEPEHVRYYSSVELGELFRGADLFHAASRLVVYPLKVHIAQKA